MSWMGVAHKLKGLRPSACVCVLPGLNREEVKDLLLQEAGGWFGNGVLTLEDLAQRILERLCPILQQAGIAEIQVPESLAGPSTRRELLKLILRNTVIMEPLSEVRRMKRQSGFVERLDRALQSARMSFAHDEEREIQDRILMEKATGGSLRPLALEMQRITLAYEVMLQAHHWVDLPLLVRQATDGLRLALLHWGSEFVAQQLALPREIVVLAGAGRRIEAREQAFWDELSRVGDFEWVRMDPLDQLSDVSTGESESVRGFRWEMWHTLEDATEALADELENLRASGARLDSVAVVFPDQPDQRRTLTRVFRERGLPLAEPRDPTAPLMDERFKSLLLSLALVSGRYERETAIAYLRARKRWEPGFSDWTRVIQERGIQQGLGSYHGEELAPVAQEFARLEALFGARLTVSEFRSRWDEEVARLLGSDLEALWVKTVSESITEKMEKEFLQVRELKRKAPVRFWWEAFRERLEEAAPPPSALRPRDGVMLYRVGQWPSRKFDEVFVLGLDDRALDGSGSGDYWRSERERELLGGEFQIKSPAWVREERKGLFNAWQKASRARPLCILDSQFNWKGSERASLLSLLREQGWVDATAELKPILKGAHSRWKKAFGPARRVENGSVELGPPQRKGSEPDSEYHLGVSAIEAYSRCPWVGVAQARWKLRDLRIASPEMWAEVRGNVLQEAINAILRHYQASGSLSLSAQDALELAWKKWVPHGLIRSPRFIEQSKREMLPVIDRFIEVEREERARTNLKIEALDDRSLTYRSGSVVLKGRPDQIEVTEEGAWFIKDYKASSASSLPTASDMLNLGYRLQLPIYALAALQNGAEEVRGIQFIALDAKGERTRGVFFKKFNGTESGTLTAHGPRVASVLANEPVEVWSQAQEQVEIAVGGYIRGRVIASPKKSTECYQCRFQMVCRKPRHVEESHSSTDAKEEETASG